MFTVKEVAEQLKVSATCVYQLVSQGRLACHRIGSGRGAIRIALADLEAFLEACRRADGPAPQPVRPSRPLKHVRR